MLKITHFTFEFINDNRPISILSFNTPKEAIATFNSKGWGMWNWTITVHFEDVNTNSKSSSIVALPMFNYLSDTWKNQNIV